jgi:DNA-binding NarL/FixJ family response regulator
METPFKIAVVDDHTLFRKGLIALLSEFSKIDVVFDASNGEELISKLEIHPIDAVLLDIEMPVMNGLETAVYLQKNHPGIRVIILTMHNEKRLIDELNLLGITSFLQKNQEIDEIVDALNGVPQNSGLIKRTTKQKKTHRVLTYSSKTSSDEKKLSEREIEIIQLISKEFTNKQIAEKLNLSIRTIDGHKERIIQKTKAKNSIGIVMYALQYNLLDD